MASVRLDKGRVDQCLAWPRRRKLGAALTGIDDLVAAAARARVVLAEIQALVMRERIARARVQVAMDDHVIAVALRSTIAAGIVNAVVVDIHLLDRLR